MKTVDRNVITGLRFAEDVKYYNILKKNKTLTKQEIIEGVMKQRHVKKGTISLNLQKNPQFVRVGRAVSCTTSTTAVLHFLVYHDIDNQI